MTSRLYAIDSAVEHERLEAQARLAELKRVLKPGRVLVSADFDGFMVEHFPVDPEFEATANRLMPQLADTEIGRKVAGHLLALGFTDVAVEADGVFIVIATVDAARRRDWKVQCRAAWPRRVELLGSEAAADRFFEAFFAHHDDPMTATWTSLYVTRARPLTNRGGRSAPARRSRAPAARAPGAARARRARRGTRRRRR